MGHRYPDVRPLRAAGRVEAGTLNACVVEGGATTVGSGLQCSIRCSPGYLGASGDVPLACTSGIEVDNYRQGLVGSAPVASTTNLACELDQSAICPTHTDADRKSVV